MEIYGEYSHWNLFHPFNNSIYKEIAINHKPIPILIINADNVVKSNGLCGLIMQ